MTVKILNNKTNTNEIKDLVFKMNAELNQNINFLIANSCQRDF